jgi:hypothetical protein
MHSRRRRITYANVASTLALVLALSGTAFAAAKITSADIVNKTIKPVDMSAKAKKALLPEARQVFKNDAGQFSSETTFGGAGLPQGQWVVVAKLWLENEGTGVHDVLCALTAGNDSDLVWSRLGPGELSSVGLTLLSSGGSQVVRANVSCTPQGGTFHAYDVKITAVKVGKTSKSDLGGP